MSEDDLMKDFAARERSRLIKLGVSALLVIALVVTAFVVMAENTTGLFRPNISEDMGERAIEAETNDPQCRAMIAEVNEASADWDERRGRFEEFVWGEDREELEQLRETATAFRSRMERVGARVEEAVLRERGTRQQLRDWFGYQDNEFRILEEMAERRRKILAEEEVEQRQGMWEDPENLRDEVLMQVDENFQSFRVWVRSGNHPCGEAPQGVKPWTSSESEAGAGSR